MKNKVAFATALFLTLLLISPAYALTLTSQTGSWDICSINNIKRSGWTSGSATFEDAVSNFQGFTLNMSFSKYEVSREWWQLNSYLSLTVKMLVQSANSSFGIKVWLQSATDAFGLYKTSFVDVAVKANATSFDELNEWLPSERWKITPNTLYVSISNDLVTVVCDNQGVNFDISIPQSYATVKIQIIHEGQGVIDASIASFHYAYVSPYEKPISTTQWWMGAWNSIQGFMGSIGEWFGYAISLLSILWSAFVWALPLFPLILIFWFLDAMITSIHEGNLQPVGKCFITIYDFIRALIQTIVNIIETILEVIPL